MEFCEIDPWRDRRLPGEDCADPAAAGPLTSQECDHLWALYADLRFVTVSCWKFLQPEKGHVNALIHTNGFLFFSTVIIISGFQMVYLHSKNPNLIIFWRALEWKILVYGIFFPVSVHMLGKEKNCQPHSAYLFVLSSLGVITSSSRVP
jgi:hypothetical protein